MANNIKLIYRHYNRRLNIIKKIKMGTIIVDIYKLCLIHNSKPADIKSFLFSNYFSPITYSSLWNSEEEIKNFIKKSKIKGNFSLRWLYLW